MQELIVNNKPAVVEVNFEELRESLERDLEKYRVVVTADTVKDAKTLATELRKTKKVIADRRKAEVAKASEPVKAFDEQMKQLEKMIDAGVDDLKTQVDRFEDETRALVREKLEALRSELWNDFAVEPEFQRAELDDLVIVSNLTQKKNLTAKGRDDLKARVMADKGLQDQTRLRLAELESESYRHGLAAPLTRDHVEHFLFADEEKYRSELSRILDAEVNRQVQAEQRERERIERQRLAEERAERDRKAREEAAEFARQAQARKGQANGREEIGKPAGSQGYSPGDFDPVSQPSEHTRPEDDAQVGKQSQACDAGTEWVTVEAVFSVEVPAGLQDQVIGDALRKKLREAGFQSEPSIKVTRGHTA